MPTVLIAILLAALLVLPADALRFELIRALRARPERLSAVLASRLAVTVPIALLLAWAVLSWAASGPAGPAMVVFTGVMTSLWLWMRFWIRTYVADLDHPTLAIDAVGVALPTGLSATLWLALFTQAALPVAWVGASPWLFGLTLLWPALDAAVLAWATHAPAAGRLLGSEAGQRRLGRCQGPILVMLASWAMWVVLG